MQLIDLRPKRVGADLRGVCQLGSNVNQSLNATLSATGDGTGVSTLRLEVSEDQTLEITSGNARFYTDAAGTLGESTTWNVTAGALRTIYLKAPSGSSVLNIPSPNKVIKWGNSSTDGWVSSTNAASISIEVGKLALTEIRMTGTSTLIGALPTGLTFFLLAGNSIAWTYSGALPTGLTFLHLAGSSIAWTYTCALPTGLTFLRLDGNSIAWTYSGALPTGLTTLFLAGSSIAWTYSGALPTGLTYIYLYGNSIAWTYSGALPTGLTDLYLLGSSINWTYSGALPTELTSLRLEGSSIAWTYTGALPTGLTTLFLSGSSIAWTYSGALPTELTDIYLYGYSINWTGLNVGNNGNIGSFGLINYRTDKMSSPDMVTLLTQLTNRTGTLPNTITINDYADYASPPQAVTDTIAALKAAKPNITTVTLGA